ncbi:hypothetical protein LTR37_014829 [Vermiconidia calcicola]|uniref:Uncharacterized protein n=1 Tax=Vermiconidia calcicola TaxID=1690605 RepID=A0ACC3MU24_9PEZI|nr:hypothetical protein LTR37_014829 [Vermiconidia calcicola]
MENVARIYAARYVEAQALFGTDRHSECIAMLEEMTYDPHLPLWDRLKTHNCLASAISAVPIAREHLSAAESAYMEIYERFPEARERLQVYREDMDETAQELDLAEQDELEAQDELADEGEQEGEEEQLEEPQESQSADSEDLPTAIPLVQQESGLSAADSLQSAGDSQPVTEVTVPSSPPAPREIRTPVSQRTSQARHAGTPSAYRRGLFNIPELPSSPTPRPPQSGHASPVRKREDDSDDDSDAAELGSPTKKGRRARS